jgi:hypothetical protein
MWSFGQLLVRGTATRHPRGRGAALLEFTNAAIAKIKEEQLEKAMCEAAPKDDEQLVALADRCVGKIIWECDEQPYRSHKVIEITTWGPLSKPPQMINGTCVFTNVIRIHICWCLLFECFNSSL